MYIALVPHVSIAECHKLITGSRDSAAGLEFEKKIRFTLF